jgi:hypothetical protein
MNPFLVKNAKLEYDSQSEIEFLIERCNNLMKFTSGLNSLANVPIFNRGFVGRNEIDGPGK